MRSLPASATESMTMTKLAFIAAGALVFFGVAAPQAHEYHKEDLTIFHPCARPAAMGQNSAAYFIIKNGGKDSETFVSAESPVAESIELHETRDENGVMKMRAIKGGVEIKPGSSLELKPGGYHIMLIDLKKPLEEGETVPLTITLAKAGAVGVDVNVEKTAPGAAEAMPMDMHGMKGMDHSAH